MAKIKKRGKIMLENIEEEIKEFTKLIKKYPDIKDLYIGRAVLYSKTGQYKKAVKDYEKGCENYVGYDIITVCQKNSLIKDAEKIYTKAIKTNKDHIKTYTDRMHFYMRIWENKKALADCETILKISPKNKIIKEMAEMLIKKLNETK